jgi:hypothetical protein
MSGHPPLQKQKVAGRPCPPPFLSEKSAAAAAADYPPIGGPCFARIREGAQLAPAGRTNGCVFTRAGTRRPLRAIRTTPSRPVPTRTPARPRAIAAGAACALMADAITVGSRLTAVAERAALRTAHAADRRILHCTGLRRRTRARRRRPVARPLVDDHAGCEQAGAQQHGRSRQKDVSEFHRCPLLFAFGSANNA